MRLTIKIFLRLQERICEKLNVFSRLEDKKKKDILKWFNPNKTKFLRNEEVNIVHKFYKEKQLPVIQSILFDINSFDNNVIKNRDFISKMLAYIKRSQRQKELRDLIFALENFLQLSIRGLYELEEITNDIISSNDPTKILQSMQVESEKEKELKNEAISLLSKLNNELNKIDSSSKEEQSIFRKLRKTSNIQMKKAGNINLALIMSLNIIAISSLLTACSTNGFVERASTKNLKNSVIEMTNFALDKIKNKKNESEVIIKIPKITFNEKVKLVNESITITDNNSEHPKVSNNVKQPNDSNNNNKVKQKYLNFKQIMANIPEDKFTKKYASFYNRRFIINAFNLTTEFVNDSNLTINELFVARAIFYEAGNQSILGKLMVASTIYNSAEEIDSYHFAKEIFIEGRYESLPKIKYHNGSGKNWEHSKRIAILMCRNKLNPDNHGFVNFLNKKTQENRGKPLPPFCYKRYKVKILEKDGKWHGAWKWKFPKTKKNLRKCFDYQDHSFYKEYNNSKSKPISYEEYLKILKKLK